MCEHRPTFKECSAYLVRLFMFPELILTCQKCGRKLKFNGKKQDMLLQIVLSILYHVISYGAVFAVWYVNRVTNNISMVLMVVGVFLLLFLVVYFLDYKLFCLFVKEGRFEEQNTGDEGD